MTVSYMGLLVSYFLLYVQWREGKNLKNDLESVAIVEVEIRLIHKSTPLGKIVNKSTVGANVKVI